MRPVRVIRPGTVSSRRRTVRAVGMIVTQALFGAGNTRFVAIAEFVLRERRAVEHEMEALEEALSPFRCETGE